MKSIGFLWGKTAFNERIRFILIMVRFVIIDKKEIVILLFCYVCLFAFALCYLFWLFYITFLFISFFSRLPLLAVVTTSQITEIHWIKPFTIVISLAPICCL